VRTALFCGGGPKSSDALRRCVGTATTAGGDIDLPVTVGTTASDDISAISTS
jgi:hypothetical protein